MKIALVLDWPSVDAMTGHPLSEWEWKVTQELLGAAGLVPSGTFTAFRAYTAKWHTLFVGNKPGGPLTRLAQDDFVKLCADLQGYDMALTLGQHAMFCLTGETKLDTFRGTHMDSPFVKGLQVVPSYSPTIFARMAWAERPVVVSAMRKVKQRLANKDRTIFLPESVADLYDFATRYIKDEIVFDVETNKACRITEFSVATSSTECLYVQLEDRAYESIWSEQDERDIWLWLWYLAQRPDLGWGFHNATFDLTYLDAYGIKPKGPIFDTMLRHHAWQPELEKSLGFLASMHIPTRAWKHLRTKAKKEFNKAGSVD